LFAASLLAPLANSYAEPLRIAYTSIAVVYGPLWLTKEAGLFKKYDLERIYEVYATKYFKSAPEATPAAIQTILEEISATRPLPPGITPQRFAESRFIRELVTTGFVDSLYKNR
jgi:hypothetical protein